ncbi:hypothetical protein scyTo_0021520 [Scyliorhinus torazame]|uniref:Myosin motor domain-containing protein n=1 Tax=Scyliorhinus torazame TaxID=75743 RepID=A0A401Q9N1_SCYTO|nr:hypothetical protein [Scyliorhinus torazame]
MCSCLFTIVFYFDFIAALMAVYGRSLASLMSSVLVHNSDTLVLWRYSILLKWNKETSSDSELCSSILETITEGTLGSYQLGLTKVFLKKKVFDQLENCWRKTQNWAALTIQKNIRGFINRKNFQIFRQKIVVIQSHIRGHQARYFYQFIERRSLSAKSTCSWPQRTLVVNLAKET